MSFARQVLLPWLLVVPTWVQGFPGPVVVSEVHYHPPDAQGELLEFVELHNGSAQPVDLGGWEIRGSIQFTVPQGCRLEPEGRVVVCRDPDVFRESFSSRPECLGAFEGELKNGGGVVDLLDRYHAIVDSVAYDDAWPWPDRADGQGASLQRVCGEALGSDPWNWSAEGPPTPGAPSPLAGCPAPEPSIPAVVISEIFFHPIVSQGVRPATEDGEDEEFVEIHNPWDTPVDIGLWGFDAGVTYTFPLGTVLEPGGYLAVCRDQALIRERFGITNAVGDFTGRLSNSGERIALVDDRGVTIDAVTYGDGNDWPYSADGYGRSLEKIILTAPGTDPACWRASTTAMTSFRHLKGEGGAGQGIGIKFVLSIDGPGEVLVDNLSVEDVQSPGVNILGGGDFDAGIEGWTASGITQSSRHAPLEGVGGTGALRLVSTGYCKEGQCGTANGFYRGVQGVVRDHTYRVTADAKQVRGSPRFHAGLYGGAEVVPLSQPTPGKPNTAAATELPPFISHVNRFPTEPRSTDATWITALIRSPSPTTVTLTYDAGSGPVTVEMLDDGSRHDGAAGDRVFGAQLPPFPHNTQARYRIHAVSGSLSTDSPLPQLADSLLPEEVWGYYVNDNQPDSPLPVYHVLVPGVDPSRPEDINRTLDCATLTVGSFAAGGDLYPDVGIRFRGNVACVVKKRNLKLSFNRIAPFRGVRKVNLNGLWSDKALVRDQLSWDFLREIGTPAMETHHARVHLNGAYHGLFHYVEHPDERFLQRTGLDSGSNLYKALQPLIVDPKVNPLGVELEPNTQEYRKRWEQESNEGGDFTDLAEFIGAMHADGSKAGGPTSEFWSQGSLEETILGYQVGQVVLNNIDSFAKNHFLYHDLPTNRWGFITWDMDLTFGKFFDPGAVQFPDRPVGVLNDVMLGDIGADLNPWFAATVLGNERLNWLIDYFFRAGNGWYQRAYLIRLWDVLQEKYRNEAYDPRIDALGDFLEAEEAEDRARWGRYPTNVPGYPEEMRPNLGIIKQQIQIHRDFLIQYIEQFHQEILSHPRLKITEIMYAPEGGDDNLEFVELLNGTDAPVDLSGWSIDGIGFVFPQGSAIPGGATSIVARSPQALVAHYPGRSMPFIFGPYPGRLSNEGEELRLLDAGPGHPATVDYVRYGTSLPWPVMLAGRSLELTLPAADRDNDVPWNWASSAVAGGTPGVTTPRFVRGDSNDDSELGLTDAVVTLGYLFRGEGAPPCLDAADSNDDGTLDLTDAVYELNFLFLGGKPPPAPYPEPGKDPTPDGLPCQGIP